MVAVKGYRASSLTREIWRARSRGCPDVPMADALANDSVIVLIRRCSWGEIDCAAPSSCGRATGYGRAPQRARRNEPAIPSGRVRLAASPAPGGGAPARPWVRPLLRARLPGTLRGRRREGTPAPPRNGGRATTG